MWQCGTVMGKRCCSQSLCGCSPGATWQVEAGSIQRDEGRRNWLGQGAGAPRVFCVQGGWCCPVVPGVTCATFPSHRAKELGGSTVCCCRARCGAGRAQRGTAMLAPITSGEQEPAEEPAAVSLAGPPCLPLQGVAQGTARASCASVWHCPAAPVCPLW